MDKRCENCGGGMVTVRADARYCSTRCRVAGNRRKKRLGGLPDELTARSSWVRFASDKRPLTAQGAPASSTDPSTWCSYREAAASSAGVGVGIVLTGDGIGCYDLDHCVVDGVISDEALAFIASKRSFYVEVSPSGTGVHIWVRAGSQKGWRRKIGDLSVEFYTRGRYITVTGDGVIV